MLESVKQFSEDTPSMRTCGGVRARAVLRGGDIGDAALYQRIGQKLRRSKASGTRAATRCSTFHAAQPVRAGRPGTGRGGPGQGRRVAQAGGGETVWPRLASARELSGHLHEVFSESDVYRIDHYLGKETYRIFWRPVRQRDLEPLWNRRYVNHVQITGGIHRVEGRACSTRKRRAGGHDPEPLLQVMATIAMEPVAVSEPLGADEKSKLLRSMRAMTRTRSAGIP